MADIYTEIVVNVIVDHALLLRENYSTDAKVISLRDSITFIDEYLERKSRDIIPTSSKTSKRHDRDRFTEKKLVQQKNTETTECMNHQQHVQSIVWLYSKDMIENNTQQMVKESLQYKTADRKNDKSSPDDECTMLSKSSEINAGLPMVGSTCDNDINETTDFDEASSGIFSGDENELDDEILEKAKRAKSVDCFNSTKHNRPICYENQTDNGRKEYKALEVSNLCSLVDPETKRHGKSLDLDKMCSLGDGYSETKESITKRTCNEVMNCILDQLEVNESCQDKQIIDRLNTCKCMTKIRKNREPNTELIESSGLVDTINKACLDIKSNNSTHIIKPCKITPSLLNTANKEYFQTMEKCDCTTHTQTNSDCSCIDSMEKSGCTTHTQTNSVRSCIDSMEKSDCTTHSQTNSDSIGKDSKINDISTIISFMRKQSESSDKSSKFNECSNVNETENTEQSVEKTEGKMKDAKSDLCSKTSDDELEPGEIPDEEEISDRVIPCNLNRRVFPTSEKYRSKYLKTRFTSGRTRYTKYPFRFNPRKMHPSFYFSRSNSWPYYQTERDNQRKPSYACDLRRRINEGEHRIQHGIEPQPHRSTGYPHLPSRNPYEPVHEYIRKYRSNESKYLSCSRSPVNFNQQRNDGLIFDNRSQRRNNYSEFDTNRASSREKFYESKSPISKFKNFQITYRFKGETTYKTKELKHESERYKSCKKSTDEHNDKNGHVFIGNRPPSECRKSDSSERYTKSLKRRRHSEPERNSRGNSTTSTRLIEDNVNLSIREKSEKDSPEKKHKLSRNKKEKKMSSVVTVPSEYSIKSTENISLSSETTKNPSENRIELTENKSFASETTNREETAKKSTPVNNDVHMKCFERIRDLAFKKAVHYSDENWNKYAKRKFVFEDELIQQLERNFIRYLHSENESTQKGSNGPLPRFVSDELMTEAIITTWKQPQIVASLDRQFREFDDIIGFVGYNIPCYWCEMIFAEGKFVRAFPVLDPIGHRDDTMYCQTDQ